VASGLHGGGGGFHGGGPRGGGPGAGRSAGGHHGGGHYGVGGRGGGSPYGFGPAALGFALGSAYGDAWDYGDPATDGYYADFGAEGPSPDDYQTCGSWVWNAPYSRYDWVPC
jgi:hypothetical protein